MIMVFSTQELCGIRVVHDSLCTCVCFMTIKWRKQQRGDGRTTCTQRLLADSNKEAITLTAALNQLPSLFFIALLDRIVPVYKVSIISGGLLYICPYPRSHLIIVELLSSRKHCQLDDEIFESRLAIQ